MGDVLAAVSLSFQVFSGCIQGYQLLSEAIALPRNYQYVRVRIKTEQFRLLNWACIAQISECDGSLVMGRAGKAMLLDVLEQQHDLLYRFGRFDERLKPLAKPLLSELLEQSQGGGDAASDEVDPFLVRFPRSADLLKRALSYVRVTRSLPRRLRWAACDKREVDTLLCKLTSLNNFLSELLNKDQVDKLLELQTRTHYGIMQLNSSLGQLLSIFQAESMQPSQDFAQLPAGHDVPNLVPESNWNSGSSRFDMSTSPPDKELGSLAQVKALNLAVHEGRLTSSFAQNMRLDDSIGQAGSVELSGADFVFLDIPQAPTLLEDPRAEAIYYQNSSRAEGTHVWIEWKHEPFSNSTNLSRAEDTGRNSAYNIGAKSRNSRLAALVSLLRHDKSTRLFRAARCLGYLCEEIPIPSSGNRTSEYRYGVVFAKPEGCDSSSRPISLLELLQSGPDKSTDLAREESFSTSCPPSLTHRVALALALVESVECLHAVNWLHKGLRSYNILFFAGNTGEAMQHDGRGSEVDQIDLSMPILSGFEYARPQLEPHWTEKGWQNPAHDLYRHPEVQADLACGSRAPLTSIFKKSYDIYALGVILLEIACWKPIHVLLGVDLDHAVLKHTISVRKRILQEKRFLQEVKASVGNIMAEVIKACMTGLKSFGLADSDNEADPDCALRLQEEFYHEVVQKLKAICV